MFDPTHIHTPPQLDSPNLHRLTSNSNQLLHSTPERIPTNVKNAEIVEKNANGHCGNSGKRTQQGTQQNQENEQYEQIQGMEQQAAVEVEVDGLEEMELPTPEDCLKLELQIPQKAATPSQQPTAKQQHTLAAHSSRLPQLQSQLQPPHFTITPEDLSILALPLPTLHPQLSAQKDKNRQPSQKQLCQCIVMVKQRFPECRLDRVIYLLHNVLVKGQEQNNNIDQYSSMGGSNFLARRMARKGEQNKMAKYLEMQHSQKQHSDDHYETNSFISQQSLSDFDKKKGRQQYAIKFQNSQANPRFYQQRQIAKLFCLKGYGYPTAREYLGDTITPNRYNNVITTIVRLAYRRVQTYILKHLQPNLPQLSRQQLKMIKTPLVNCRNWMSQQQAETFHRFVRMTYKIKTEQPQREYVMELYQAVVDQLKKRNVTYRPHRRGGDPNSWSNQMDFQLVSAYIRNQNILAIQQHLGLLFPSHRQCFEQGRLRLRLERLLRLALRKLYTDRDKYGLTVPAALSEYLVGKLSRNDSAMEVRKRVIGYYIDPQMASNKVKLIGEMLEEWALGSRGDVEEIGDSSCEVVAKEELKVEGEFGDGVLLSHLILHNPYNNISPKTTTKNTRPHQPPTLKDSSQSPSSQLSQALRPPPNPNHSQPSFKSQQYQSKIHELSNMVKILRDKLNNIQGQRQNQITVELRVENARLNRENKQLRRRVAELEKMLKEYENKDQYQYTEKRREKKDKNKGVTYGIAVSDNGCDPGLHTVRSHGALIRSTNHNQPFPSHGTSVASKPSPATTLLLRQLLAQCHEPDESNRTTKISTQKDQFYEFRSSEDCFSPWIDQLSKQARVRLKRGLVREKQLLWSCSYAQLGVICPYSGSSNVRNSGGVGNGANKNQQSVKMLLVLTNIGLQILADITMEVVSGRDVTVTRAASTNSNNNSMRESLAQSKSKQKYNNVNVRDSNPVRQSQGNRWHYARQLRPNDQLKQELQITINSVDFRCLQLQLSLSVLSASSPHSQMTKIQQILILPLSKSKMFKVLPYSAPPTSALKLQRVFEYEPKVLSDISKIASLWPSLKQSNGGNQSTRVLWKLSFLRRILWLQAGRVDERMRVMVKCENERAVMEKVLDEYVFLFQKL